MKGKKLIIFVIMIICTILLFFMTTGFRKRTDVGLINFSVSEDGSVMTLDVTVTSTIGYARAMKVKQGGDNKYITFYSTFGLLNSKIGANSEYELNLNPSCEEIYFYKGDGGYKLVLQKNIDTNQWEMIR